MYMVFSDIAEHDSDHECQRMALQALMLLENAVKNVSLASLCYYFPSGGHIIFAFSAIHCRSCPCF